MNDILCYVNATTWVIFDVDNTLITSKTHYGSAKWHYWESQRLKHQGLDDEKIYKVLRSQSLATMEKCPIALMEPMIPAIVSDAQKRAFCVFGLTARHPEMKDITLLQLRSVFIDLSVNSGFLSTISQGFSDSSLFWDGIWFLSVFNQKGKAIRHLLRQSESLPSRIVFIDDVLNHLFNMEDSLVDSGVELIAIHYMQGDELFYDPEIAAIQAFFFPKIVSNEEAKKILHDKGFEN